MIRQTLHIGTRHKDSKSYIGSREECNNIIIETFAEFGIDGMTIYNATGVLKGVRERTQFVEIFNDNEQAIRAAAEMLTLRLHQEEIYLNGEPIKYPVGY